MGTGVISDPIGDLLTRIRNGLHARHAEVVLPHSSVKARIAEILMQEGYLTDVQIEPSAVQGKLRVTLKYTPDRKPVILGLRRVSKPGLRVYAGWDEVRKVQGGLGVAILSTSRGLMVDREARRSRIGGEVLCEVW
ncbi:MAG TPA: 30S ribosomal protein S8 [Actinomycetota bacterium]|nr:30S ribosomal protein S8 [Actinomycetota bacterium]